jgi:hypothetical protein
VSDESTAGADEIQPLVDLWERKSKAQAWAEAHEPVVRVLCRKCRKTRGTNGVYATDVGLALILTSWLGVPSEDERAWIKKRKAEGRSERYSSITTAMVDTREPTSFRCACSHDVRWVDWDAVDRAIRSTRRHELPI